MASDDIYKSKEKYEKFKEGIEDFWKPPPEDNKKRKYYCKNKDNLQYFKKLFLKFEAQDLSYVRRVRVLGTMKLICFLTGKDLKDLDRDDIDKLVSQMHKVYKTPKSKTDFLRDIKNLWRRLFPELDEKGREDETLTPYVVRHLKTSIDKSREVKRQDKLQWVEYEKILDFFSKDLRMVAYISLAVESLARPQELLYLKIGDVEAFDTYAKIHMSEHGKEGLGILQCIDSWPYVSNWLSQHPMKKDKRAYLFPNINGKIGGQMTPANVNKKLRNACKALKLDKPITCYSLKRNGVTFRRARGDSDSQIQHAARWTSTKQLKVYDLSTQEDSFKIELAKRGIIKDDRLKEYYPKTKTCQYCGQSNGFNEDYCNKCRRSLNREKIKEAIAQQEELMSYKEEIKLIIEFFKHEEIKELFQKVIRLKRKELPF